MFVMMPVNVVSKACAMCPRLKIVIENEYNGAEITDRSMECGNYDDCLLAIETWKKGSSSDERCAE